MTSSNMGKHCQRVHGKERRSLKEGEQPEKPEYRYWRKNLKDPSKYRDKKYPKCVTDPEKFFEPSSQSSVEEQPKRITKKKLKTLNLKARENKKGSKRTLTLACWQPTKQIKKLDKRCANPRVAYKVGWVTENQKKKVLKYGKYHCVLYHLMKQVMAKER